MPEFIEIPCVETKVALLGAIRLSIAAEMEAVNLYEGIAEKCDNPLVKKVMKEVAHDEMRHVGTFRELLERLNPKEFDFEEEGEEEAEDLMGKEK
jgi:rubrerythrin